MQNFYVTHSILMDLITKLPKNMQCFLKIELPTQYNSLTELKIQAISIKKTHVLS